MPSSVLTHTVPPFYAVYFLRSLSTPSATYIGSTPDPPRRKRQHNGELTQGAWRTSRSRPWEIECIVYGFASKIAALQFEWAWSKPHLSRHLRTHDSNSTPLFPSSRLTPATTRNGRPKRQRPIPPSSPNSRILVLRALLRSEPFSAWGLRLAFFSEWSWAAFHHCEQQRMQHAAQTSNTSRLGRHLHHAYPHLVCDFRGVDGKRKALSLLAQEESAQHGLFHVPRPSKTSAASRSKPKEPSQNATWPEQLPKVAHLKAYHLSVNDIRAVPVPAPSVPSTEPAKSTRKPNGKNASERTSTSENALGPSMAFHDGDFSQRHWERFERFLQSQSPCLKMDTLVQAASSASAPTRSHTHVPCGICSSDVDLLDHASYSLCPTPCSDLHPRPLEAQTRPIAPHAHACASAFHLTCLAEHFLSSTRHQDDKHDFVLPSHGSCPAPSHSDSDSAQAFWSDVVRAVFRRKERFDRLVKYRSGVEPTASESEQADEDEEFGEQVERDQHDADLVAQQLSDSDASEGTVSHEPPEPYDDGLHLSLKATGQASDPICIEDTPPAKTRKQRSPRKRVEVIDLT